MSDTVVDHHALDQLQKLADYFLLRSEIRLAKRITQYLGIGLICVSLIAGLGRGIYWAGLLLGIFTVGESFWQASKPTPGRLLFVATVFGTVGLWKFIAVFQAPAAADVELVVVHAIMLGIAGSNLRWYPRFHKLYQEEFTEDQLTAMEEIYRVIHSGKAHQAADLFEFEVDLRAGGRKWKCKLYDGWAMINRIGTRELIVVSEWSFEILSCSKKWFFRDLSARFHIKGHYCTGWLSTDSLRKYAAWKAEVTAAESMPEEAVSV